MEQWKLRKSENIISNRWLTVRKDAVDLPNGTSIDDFYTVGIPDAAAIVAITPDLNIVLKREFKYATGEELIEVPAGMFEPDEHDGLSVAKRELLEETGYVSEDWTYFGDTVESSSKLSNRMHIYLARDCRKVADQKLDATEDVEVLVMSLKDAVEKVMSNEIKCNSSANGILKAARIFGL